MVSIVVDSLPIIGCKTGIGRYTYEILTRLPADQFDVSYYIGYITKNKKRLEGKTVESFAKRVINKMPFKRLIKSFFLNRYQTSKDFDIYWQPNFIPLKTITAQKVIATVHDFSWEIYPDFHPPDRINYFKENFYKNINLASRIITISNYIKNEILERLPNFEGRIDVIYNGYNDSIFKPMGSKKKYILFVGTIEPRKNLERIIRSYNMLKDTIKRDYPLIIVGSSGWKNRKIFDMMDNKHIKYLGFVDDPTLAKLYAEATLFLYPSLYEGFGLPVVEALASGTATITSKNSSMEEISKNAAILVDPYNCEEIAFYIEKLIFDTDLRKRYENLGLSVAKNYSWERSASEHIEVFLK